MKREMALLGDAIGDGALEFGTEREHGAENFAQRSEVVIGDPLAETHELPVEHGRGIEHADDVLGLYGGFAVMQVDDDAAHALLPERHQYTASDGRLHTVRNAVGEGRVQRNWQGYITELGSGSQTLISSFEFPVSSFEFRVPVSGFQFCAEMFAQ